MSYAEQLRAHPGFADLPPAVLQAAGTCFTALRLQPGEIALVEGSSDRRLLLSIEGELVVLAGTPAVELGRRGPGEIFGEMTLLGALPRRTATVQALTFCALLVLDERGLEALRTKAPAASRALEIEGLCTLAQRLREVDAKITSLGRSLEHRSNAPGKGPPPTIATQLLEVPDDPPDAAETLLASLPFRGLERDLLTELAAHFVMERAGAGRPLLSESAPTDDFWVVAAGRIGVYRRAATSARERVASLETGALFGLLSLIDARPPSATCAAMDEAWVLRMSGADYRDLVGSDTQRGARFRKALIEALSSQLRAVDRHLVGLTHQEMGREAWARAAAAMVGVADP